MIKLSKTESTRFNKIKNLLVKILCFGKKDIIECLEGQHFGIDSRPVKGQIAIIARTTGQEDVILGYITKDRLAQVGETRLYSVDDNGVMKTYLWLKNNGNIEIGGNSDNFVKWTPLNFALQLQITKINSELAKISLAINSIGGAYAPEILDIDITASKTETIKTA